MRILYVLMIFFSTITVQAEQMPGLPEGMSAGQYYSQEWPKWMDFSKDYNTAADVPYYVSNAKTENELLDQLHDLEKTVFPKFPSGAIGWMSQRFIALAYNMFHACEIDQSLEKYYPQQWKVFSENFYAFHILSVPFNLCQDNNTSDCSLNMSFAAKNYPNLKLIMVNAYRWNMMSEDERKALAVHEFLGVIGIEEGSYDLSADFQLNSLKTSKSHGYNEKFYCVHRKAK